MQRILHRGETLSIGTMHRVLVLGHAKAPPNKEDWAALCTAIEAEHASARGQLVLSRGGVPDAAQRKAAIDVLPKGFKPPPIAVLADQTVVRGVITVLNWFLANSHRAFKRSDVAGVAEHLKLTLEEARELVQFAEELAPT